MNTKSVAAVAALMLSVSAPGLAQAETLIIAHGFQPSHVLYTQAAVPWMTCVTERTDGAIEFDDYPSGQISGHNDSINSLNSGIAQVSGVLTAYESAKLPLSQFAQLPGVGTSSSHRAAAFREMIENGSAIAQEQAAANLVPLINLSTPGYQIMSTGERVDTMDKMKGLKLRAAAGPNSYAVEALGATPIEIAGGDMYVALQRGTVDGTILSMTSAPAYNMHELIKSASTNGSFAAGHTTWTMDKRTYDRLPADQQTAIQDCAREVEISANRFLDEENEGVIADYASRGIDMYEFPPEMVEQINAALEPVAASFVAQLDGRGLPGTETFELFQSALEETQE